jgi:hypothetical protein
VGQVGEVPRLTSWPLDPMSSVACSCLSCQQPTRKRPAMSTVTSADGTPIDYDGYGCGPAVILIGGTTQHRAIDRRTTEIAQHWGERASRQSTMTGGAVAAQATPRRGRLTGKSRTSTLSSRLLGDPRRSTLAPLAQPSRSPRSPPASQSRRSPSTSRPTSPVLMAASTSPRSSECWTRASTTEPAATT